MLAIRSVDYRIWVGLVTGSVLNLILGGSTSDSMEPKVQIFPTINFAHFDSWTTFGKTTL